MKLDNSVKFSSVFRTNSFAVKDTRGEMSGSTAGLLADILNNEVEPAQRKRKDYPISKVVAQIQRAYAQVDPDYKIPKGRKANVQVAVINPQYPGRQSPRFSYIISGPQYQAKLKDTEESSTRYIEASNARTRKNAATPEEAEADIASWARNGYPVAGMHIDRTTIALERSLARQALQQADLSVIADPTGTYIEALPEKLTFSPLPKA